jgi:hypothetical protein
MPEKLRRAPHAVARRTYLRHGYEKIIAGYFLRDGWQVFLPMLDDSHATDIIIADGTNYFRIQVKTVERRRITGYLKLSHVTGFAPAPYVIVVSVNSDWGLIFNRAIVGATNRLWLDTAIGVLQFQWQHPRSLIKAFNATI